MYKKTSRKDLIFYIVFALFILWIVFEPTIKLSISDGVCIILLVSLAHSWILKRHLLLKVSEKYTSQKKLLKNIFMNCPDIIYQKNEHLSYMDCNPAMKRMFNIDINSSISGKTDYDLYPKETADLIRKYDKNVIKNTQVVSYKIGKKLFNGETKIYDTLLAPVINSNGETSILGIMRDITQTETLKEQILIQNAQLNSILDNAPFYIYLKDLNGKVIMANKKIIEHMHKTFEEIIGETPENSEMQKFGPIIKRDDSIVIKTKEPIAFEYESDFLSNHKCWYRMVKSPIINKEGDVIGIIVVVINIDNEKRLQAKKETFVATLTHDLKTPTTAQTNAMNLLLTGALGDLNDEQKEMVRLALDSNKYMYSMISTILDTYKSESGKQVLNKSEFNFVELVNITCKEITNLATMKNQNLVINTQNDVFILNADKLQIKRAVVNLVSNAITYGLENTKIELQIYENENNIIMEVKNQSKCITQEKLKEVFEKYKTAENAKFNKMSTGLELYLSKQIITAHSGEIFAKCPESEVCIFGFSLPKEIAPIKTA